MTSTQWASAASTALFGSIPVPFLASLTPASIYNGCQLYLKSLILMFPLLFVVNAPFGRFASSTSYFRLPGRLAFALMEVPSPIFCLLALASSKQLSNEPVGKISNISSSLLHPSWSHLTQLPAANLILASLFVIHYIHRAILQPIYGPKRSSSHISVFLSAFICQTANGFTMGSWLGGSSPAFLIPTNLLTAKSILKASNPLQTAGWFAGILPKSKVATVGPVSSVLPLAHAGLLPHGVSTLLHPTFLIGVTGWAIFFLANVYHDEILFNLRRPAKRGDGPAQGTLANANKDADVKSVTDSSSHASPRYEIPEGGLYSLISFPNYYTEWLEWFFFAVAALSQSSLSPLSSSSPPLTTLGRWSLLLTAPPLLFPLMEVSVMLPRAINGHAWYRRKFGVQGDGKGGRYPKGRKAVIPYLI
ncbi:hypothetical protein CBS101457_001771 [Exobasidium rhododendri]|nr:hypothetical protein CBS101457_001771 [Exobasidium rhododendri]